MGKQAVMANPHETRREHMHQEPTDELDRRERHGPLATVLGIIFPTEAHLPLLETEQAAVADGHPVSVPSQVFQDLLGTPEGRLGIHHPVGLGGLGQEAVEGFGPGPLSP